MPHETNRESWASLLVFVDLMQDTGWLEWKNFMRPLLRSAIDAGWDDRYRAGQSMQHLIFSTAKQNGLESIKPPPLRVTLGQNDDHRFFVALSRANLWFNKPDRIDMVTPGNALSVLASYLSALE